MGALFSAQRYVSTDLVGDIKVTEYKDFQKERNLLFKSDEFQEKTV